MSAAADALRRDAKVIALVALAHGLSHFYQIATAVLFPLIKDDLGVSYTALGGTIALYYIVSGVCQTLAGFAVDRYGARRVLFTGLALAVAGALLAGLAQNFPMLVMAAVVGGVGNSVFHPVDFSILNARVSKHRLGYAFSWHGIAGYLGFAAAPAYGIAMATSRTLYGLLEPLVEDVRPIPQPALVHVLFLLRGLGMAPLIFMPGRGAELYRGLAAVVAGGMVVGTTFTWLLLPSLLRLGEGSTVPAMQIGADVLPGEST